MNETLYQTLFIVLFLAAASAKLSNTIKSNDISKYPGLPAKQIMLTFRETCQEYSGSDEGFQQFILSMQPTKRCLKKYVDLARFEEDVSKMTENNRREIFENYCPKFNESQVCFEGMIDAVATCINQNTNKTKTLLAEMVNNAVELMCRDDGEIFFESRKPEFRSCIKNIKQYVKECRSSNIAGNTSLTEFGYDECTELNNSRNCMKAKVTECNAEALMDIVDIYYNPIQKANECDYYFD
ncbi:uncharacterized protein LOC129721266 isoform X2 [Wyeomyia smithii]|uniref:uncharacterized protein LOC129721266 isoform X2 n=1 Tax=Wyeomyia smithii TaxID=174621 RepID=UPI002467E754|nr:uncharacterized protein LOC129721266 isoform X2 [Wyeomyia smithii]